jgi:glycosyltransferase 2 family protein
MYAKLRKLWPFVKWAFFVVLAFYIGRMFYQDLTRPDLHLFERDLHPGWLLLAALLYLMWFGGSTFYWRDLLASFNRRPPLLATARAYYIGQLGKYVPGKAVALLMRANLIHPFGVGRGLATLTAFYEVLTTMASGALVALLLFAFFGNDTPESLSWHALPQIVKLQLPADVAIDRKDAALLCAFFVCAYGVPILPPIFNWVVHHVSLPFRRKDALVPRFQLAVLLKGILFTSIGWLFLGSSLIAVVYAVCGPELDWTPAKAGRMMAFMALGWFGSFVIPVPGGLGPREGLIVLFLTPEILTATNGDVDRARALAIVVALVMRLMCVTAELAAAGALYWLPMRLLQGVAVPAVSAESSPSGEGP